MDGVGSLAQALQYEQEGKIEEWIQLYLCNEGENEALAKGLKLEERFYIGPMKMPLNQFKRCCGPEEDMEYPEEQNEFDRRVNNLVKMIQDGWDMPPLIVNYTDKKFQLSDGNHRHEALLRSGRKEYYFIIWVTKKEEYEQLMHFKMQ